MQFATPDQSRAYIEAMNAASVPQLLPAQINNFLKRSGTPYALDRMKFELALIGEDDVAAGALDTQIFRQHEMLQSLRIDLQRSEANKSKNGIVEVTSTIEELTAQMTMVRSKRAAVSARQRPLNARQNTCRRLIIQAIAGSTFKFVPPPRIDGKITLASVRDRILTRRADIVEYESAPLPLADARRAAVAWLEKRARFINFAPLLEPDGRDPYVPMIVLNATDGSVESSDALCIDIGAHMAQYVKLAEEQLSRAAREDEALSHEDRASKIARAKTEILAAERIEAAIEWDLWSQGKSCELRADANPLAILSVISE